jgi:hypothetical protein
MSPFSRLLEEHTNLLSQFALDMSSLAQIYPEQITGSHVRKEDDISNSISQLILDDF